ncbi:hypothetical protein PC41400_21610 [Paenibacillus chitinolyticus]|uniref:Uncharacterized protein n=1 Tax=Paenibacillus chitinolyticus TaxID=79263 RepID=A0A410X0B5_9BACL|nr:hypothetical protein [Paenibacillus chitinolyticus]MCY9593727.1 hypothetical protein [Paenibacillus chitinolyticus]MCY9599707.1 hypothetical protein [Paenibacillus chitinolyticus]QAV20119.1 hypothetical protein PC41400_21610 [Paenibacillus chitinolyticus]
MTKAKNAKEQEEGIEPKQDDGVALQGVDSSQNLDQEKAGPDPAANEPDNKQPSNETVQLIGTDSERTGSHTLFYEGAALNFINGEIEVKAELAAKLREAGFVE